MRKVFKTISVTLAIMAVVYGMSLKYAGKTPQMAIETIVLPIIVTNIDSVTLGQDELYFEEPD